MAANLMAGDNITWTAFAILAITFRTAATALAIVTHMPRKNLKELHEALRQAEARLEAATKRSEVNAAAKKVMRAKEALKAAQEAAERHARAEGLE